MYKYSKLLIGLDDTEMDTELIRASSDICKLSGSKEVYFINVIKDFNLPESVQREFPDLLQRALNERKESLQKKVDEYFHYPEATVVVNVVVEEGQVTKAILSYASEKKIDLIVLGRKNEKKNGGILLTRVARRAACSLLIIPKGSSFKLNRILVPTDFSDYSRKAMEKALTFARRTIDPSLIIVQNVYQVPVGYHYTGKSFKEFAAIMKENAARDYDRFMAGMNIKGVTVEHTYSLDKDDDIITDIYKMAKKKEVDLIVIGAKGRTATAALFIGSKAERLVQVDSEIPMLVVRPKGKSAGLLEYIKEL